MDNCFKVMDIDTKGGYISVFLSSSVEVTPSEVIVEFKEAEKGGYRVNTNNYYKSHIIYVDGIEVFRGSEVPKDYKVVKM